MPAPSSKPGSGQGGGGGAPPDPCNIIERAKINSPDATVRATLRLGDVLALVYDPGPPKRLLARTGGGATLGSITSPAMPQIIQCILAGFDYDAVVLTIQGGLIEVQIQPR